MNPAKVNAVSVGTKTVKGPVPLRVLSNPVCLSIPLKKVVLDTVDRTWAIVPVVAIGGIGPVGVFVQLKKKLQQTDKINKNLMSLDCIVIRMVFSQMSECK